MTDPTTVLIIALSATTVLAFVAAILNDIVQHVRVAMRRSVALNRRRASRFHRQGEFGISPKEIRSRYPTVFVSIGSGRGVRF